MGSTRRRVCRFEEVLVRLSFLTVLATCVCACNTVEFYRQAVSGQVSILARRESIPTLIASPDTAPELRARLESVRRILVFARERLGLEPGDRYMSYVRIRGEYVVWNVFAAPEFSTQPTQWCYPVIGCASYRGYFDRGNAVRYAARLAAERQDAVVGGVAAYSTLGWFDDPVMSTFIDWSDAELAGLIFHELAHARVFIAGDTSFNEAFANFVERRGVVEWLRANGTDAQIEEATERWRHEDRFSKFLLAWRDELQRLYDHPYNDDALRMLKFDLFASLEQCYRTHRDRLGDQDWFFHGSPNNGRFVPLAAYNELIGGFKAVFVASGSDWPAFYARVRALGKRPIDERTAELKRVAGEQANDSEAVPIECEALTF
ncbi:MAG TPA: aminopeptidase [Pseudomonadales bacterium]|nr:aminopeptidase [Pseudomonadales bacterium]